MGSNQELESFATTQVKIILAKHTLTDSTLQDEFHTLSPDLLIGIAKAFYILNDCLPQLFKGGAYCEFGLYRGFSLWFAQQIQRVFNEDDFRFFGFDSFEGLPAESQDFSYINGWNPGNYAASIEEVTENIRSFGGDLANIQLIKGWFSQRIFSNWANEFGSVKPAIMTIDSDVYEACKEILDFFAVHHIQLGTILVFDDFINTHHSPEINKYGERKALQEFLLKNKDVELTSLFSFGWHGYAFMVTACNGISLQEKIKMRIQELVGSPKPPDFPLSKSTTLTFNSLV